MSVHRSLALRAALVEHSGMTPDSTPALRVPMNSLSSHTVRLDDFEAIGIDGARVDFRTLHGRVVLIVNTASACGFTPQFGGLEALWERFRARGFTVIGFPSNEFGAQDAGSDDEIAAFCQRNYGVSFPMMAKIEVNGAVAHPLFQWLKVQAPGFLGSEAVKWNFTKFLVGRDGKVIRRYAPQTSPDALAADIESALGI